MRLKQLAIIVIVTALAFGLDTTPTFAAGAAAKAWLAQAQQAANKWKADAALVNISTLAANMDGTANKWGYMFYSAKAKQGYTVDVQDGKIIETLEVNPWITDPVGGDFVDSPQAMMEAKKNGLKVKGKGKPAMALMMMGQATKNPWTAWSVVVYEKGGISILIDGKTGKFSSKHEVP